MGSGWLHRQGGCMGLEQITGIGWGVDTEGNYSDHQKGGGREGFTESRNND